MLLCKLHFGSLYMLWKKKSMTCVDYWKMIDDFPYLHTKKQRNKKSAYLKYSRLNEKLSLNKHVQLLFERKTVLQYVSKTLQKSKCEGYKKLQTRVLACYAGISSKNILKVASNDAELKTFNSKFQIKLYQDQ